MERRTFLIGSAGLAIGASVCCDGCCLTVVGKTGDTLSFDVAAETLAVTTLGQWREGALQGRGAREAWYVRCGAGSTMTADDVAQGRVVCEIGVALLRPAEFVVLRWTGATAGALQPDG